MNTDGTLACKSHNRLGLRRPMPVAVVLGVVAAATQSGQSRINDRGYSGHGLHRCRESNIWGPGAIVGPKTTHPVTHQSSFPFPSGSTQACDPWLGKFSRKAQHRQ